MDEARGRVSRLLPLLRLLLLAQLRQQTHPPLGPGDPNFSAKDTVREAAQSGLCPSAMCLRGPLVNMGRCYCWDSLPGLPSVALLS